LPDVRIEDLVDRHEPVDGGAVRPDVVGLRSSAVRKANRHEGPSTSTRIGQWFVQIRQYERMIRLVSWLVSLIRILPVVVGDRSDHTE